MLTLAHAQRGCYGQIIALLTKLPVKSFDLANVSDFEV